MQATLAAGALDLTPSVDLPGTRSERARLNREYVDFNAPGSMTYLDMRLSADEVTVGAYQAGPHAFGAQLRGGALARECRRGADVARYCQGASSGTASSDAAAERQGVVPVQPMSIRRPARSETFGIIRLSGCGLARRLGGGLRDEPCSCSSPGFDGIFTPYRP